MNTGKLVSIGAYSLKISLAILQIFPMIWLTISSFKTNNEIVMKGAFEFPEKWQFVNYKQAWLEGRIDSYFLNSIFISIVTVAVTLFLSGMIAYAIARMRWRFNGIILFLFLAGLMVPVHVTLIPLFIILKNMHLLSTYLGIILPYISMGLPLGVFVFVNFFRSLPIELEQAAAIDGCTIYQTFFRIVFPVVMPAISAVAIFSFLNVWNEFIVASTFINDDHLKTLPLGLMNFMGTYSTQWALMAAAIVIASLPVVLFYIFFSNQVEKSFTAGAILK